MANHEQPYDPYIPAGSAAPGQHQGGDGRTAALQAKINETVGIMKQNLTKTDERGVHIDNLATSSENVNHQSLQFKASARKVKRQMCVSNMKWTFILIGVAIIVIVVIIAVSVSETKHK